MMFFASFLNEFSSLLGVFPKKNKGLFSVLQYCEELT